MKVVIDTNVVVSAALRDRDPQRLIARAVAEPHVEWLVTQEILREYIGVLSRPRLRLTAGIVNEWSEMVRTVTTTVTTEIVVPLPRDVKDAPFLACAVAGDADYIVTGDRDFQAAAPLPRTRIVTVAEFLRILG